jgi:hypothetical protein
LAQTSGKECKGEVIGQENIEPLDAYAVLSGEDPICASKEGQTIESVHINSLGNGGGKHRDLYCIEVYETSDCSGDITFGQEYDSSDDLCMCSVVVFKSRPG